METIHLHQDPQNSNLNIVLLLLPSIVFALIIFSFYFVRKNDKSPQVATEAGHSLSSELNVGNYSVLGDQDGIDTTSTESLE